MFDVPYVNAGNLAAEALGHFLPPERLNTAQYAIQHRLLANAGGGHVGRFDPKVAPYCVQPMEALDGLDHLTVAVVGPGQLGKTVIAENWLQKSVENDPADFLWYMQTDDGLESYVKARINPMIQLHDGMRTRLGRRPIDDSLHFKNFASMRCEFLAFGDSSLRNKSAPRIVADEVDGYAWLGDVKPPLDVRRQTFGRQSMLLAMSHPDKARGLNPAKDWTAGIMAFYADSDRRCWYWPCPQCGCWSSPVPTAARVMTVEYRSEPDTPLDVVEREAHLLCPNGCIVADHHRRDMNLQAYRAPFGGWIGEGQTLAEDGTLNGELARFDTAGFWMVGAMSPFVLGGIGGLARERVKAQRDLEASGEEAGLREVMVKWWGVPYKKPRTAGTVEAKDIVERVEPGLIKGYVPKGVRFLIAVVDCQAWGFEYLVRGFGMHGESWIVDHGRFAQRGDDGARIDPATSPDDWNLLYTKVFHPYPLADGSGRTMSLRGAGYDMHGAPGVSAQAYAAWARWKSRGDIRLYGAISGREAWSHIPLRGASGLNAPRLITTYPDTGRAAGQATKGTVPVAQHNPNTFKADLAGQLKRATAGANFVHFPAWLKSKEEPHVFFEQLVAERQLPNGRWEKISATAKNEALDLMVMSHALAHLHGLSRLDWDAPPTWAAPWDENSAVSAGPPAVNATGVIGKVAVGLVQALTGASAARTPAPEQDPAKAAEAARKARLAALIDKLA